MKKRIHVNQHIIKSNQKQAEKEPPLSCITYKRTERGNTMLVKDKSGNVVGTFYYSPDKPLSCGAHVWFETDLEVEII